MTAPKRRRTLTNKAQTSLGKMSAKALAVIDAALDNGDAGAAITVISYIVPKPKPVNGETFNIQKTIAGLTIPEQVQIVSDALLNGEISMESADLVFSVLIKGRGLLESTDFENRIVALENNQHGQTIAVNPPITFRTSQSNSQAPANPVPWLNKGV